MTSTTETSVVIVVILSILAAVVWPIADLRNELALTQTQILNLEMDLATCQNERDTWMRWCTIFEDEIIADTFGYPQSTYKQ
jgi:hypothetical protein